MKEYKLKLAIEHQYSIDKLIDKYNLTEKKCDIYKQADLIICRAKQLDEENEHLTDLFEMLYIFKHCNDIKINGVRQNSKEAYEKSINNKGSYIINIHNSLSKRLNKFIEKIIDDEGKDFYINVGIIDEESEEEKLRQKNAEDKIEKTISLFKENKISEEKFRQELFINHDIASLHYDDRYRNFFSDVNLTKIVTYHKKIKKAKPNQYIGKLTNCVFGFYRENYREFVEAEDTKDADLIDTEDKATNTNVKNKEEYKTFQFIFDFYVALNLINDNGENNYEKYQYIRICKLAYEKLVKK